MSLHIAAKPGAIASKVLLPGDPLRAKYVADNFLTDVTCYNEIRGMYGFTGKYKGEPISVQGTGMGIPSISIYLNELITEYQVKTLIRIGSCGALHQDIKLKDLILAMSASTDSNLNNSAFPTINYAPTANFDLLHRAYEISLNRTHPVKVGSIFTSDLFYDNENPEGWKKWAEYGMLAVEMETAALYSLAAKFGVAALAILTVSDNLATKDLVPPKDRQNTFDKMVQLALDVN